MKNYKNLNGLVSVMIIALLVLSAVPLAFAENEADNNNANETNNANEAAKELFRDTKKDWTTARGEYVKSKTEKKTNETIEKARNYLLAADDTMIKYLNTIKAKIQSTQALSAEDHTVIVSDI